MDDLNHVLHDLGSSLKELVRSETELVKAEIKDTATELAKHTVQAGVFGGLLVLGVLPFLAFLIIGLGMLMGGNYWLSSLIVSGVCATIGGGLSLRAYRKIRAQDLALPHSREALHRESASVEGKVREIREEVTQRPA